MFPAPVFVNAAKNFRKQIQYVLLLLSAPVWAQALPSVSEVLAMPATMIYQNSDISWLSYRDKVVVGKKIPNGCSFSSHMEANDNASDHPKVLVERDLANNYEECIKVVRVGVPNDESLQRLESLWGFKRIIKMGAGNN